MSLLTIRGSSTLCKNVLQNVHQGLVLGDILKYDYNPEIHSDIGQGLPQWIEKYAHIFTEGNSDANNITEYNTITAITKSSNNTYTWEVDQLIISRAILESGLCTLPANNTLWAAVNLDNHEKK